MECDINNVYEYHIYKDIVAYITYGRGYIGNIVLDINCAEDYKMEAINQACIDGLRLSYSGKESHMRLSEILKFINRNKKTEILKAIANANDDETEGAKGFSWYVEHVVENEIVYWDVELSENVKTELKETLKEMFVDTAIANLPNGIKIDKDTFDFDFSEFLLSYNQALDEEKSKKEIEVLLQELKDELNKKLMSFNFSVETFYEEKTDNIIVLFNPDRFMDMLRNDVVAQFHLNFLYMLPDEEFKTNANDAMGAPEHFNALYENEDIFK